MKFLARLFNPAYRPSAATVLHTQLKEAELSRAEHVAAKEYHAAMEMMLDARISRLRFEIKDSPTESSRPRRMRLRRSGSLAA